MKLAQQGLNLRLVTSALSSDHQFEKGNESPHACKAGTPGVEPATFRRQSTDLQFEEGHELQHGYGAGRPRHIRD
jgi:hypothetical protein